MRKLFSTTLILFLGSCLFAQTDSLKAQSPKLLLEEGHIIWLTLSRDIGSGVAQVGNKVYFQVDSAVVIAGTTVVPKGTKAYGAVNSVRKRNIAGLEGKLTFSINKLVLDGGGEILLTANHSASGKSKVESVVVETVLLSPLFLLKKGKDVVYKEGKPFIAFTTGDYTF